MSPKHVWKSYVIKFYSNFLNLNNGSKLIEMSRNELKINQNSTKLEIKAKRIELEAKWVQTCVNGSDLRLNGSDPRLTGRISRPPPVYLNFAAAARAQPCRRSGSRRRRATTPQLRLEKRNPMTPSVWAAVTGVARKSSIYVEDGGGARRSNGDIDDPN